MPRLRPPPMLEPSRNQIEIFVEALFRYASPHGIVAVRSFYDNKKEVFRRNPTALTGGLKFLVDVAEDEARRAAQSPQPVVFCPPIATFVNKEHAREKDILEGLALSVECDKHPQQARAVLEGILGLATVTVESGGRWTNGNGEVEDRLHLHWRLAVPARDGSLTTLKSARDLAARLVGGDTSGKSVVHPFRWPGSWHRKADPRPCQIVKLNADNEIRLEDAFAALTKAAEVAKLKADTEAHTSGEPEADIARVEAALAVIPNNDIEWDDWNRIGMAAHRATAGSAAGLKAFDKWSRKSKKYNEETTRARWLHYHTSPPDRIGFGTLSYLATQASPGWDSSASRSQKKDNARDWSDPDWSLLDDRRGELPEFPMDVFSIGIQKVITRTARGAGVTNAHVAVPFIGIVSSLIGIARRVKATSSWLQCTTCWTVLVGFSGTGKTPGINVTKRALNQYERDNKAAADERRRKHETKKAEAKAAHAKWTSEVEKAVKDGQPPPQMPAAADNPGTFIPVKLWVADATIERLADLLSARPQGVLLLRDELSALFTNMSRYSNGQDNEFWLEAWNGDAFSQERMSRMLNVDHLLVGIAGGMQPDKLAKSFEGDHDGMYARVLFAWPPEPGYSPLTDDAQEVDVDILNIITRINKLAEFADDKLVIRDIPLSPGAKDRFAQFLQFAHRGKEAFEGREREWHAKMTAHALRLAGALTFLEWALDIEAAEPKVIDEVAMTAAIRLVRDYFWLHARACLRQIGLTEQHTYARRVLRWLQANHKHEVSREDVRRDALSQRLDATQTESLLKALCNFAWTREQNSPSGPHGGKPVRRWLVNPRLFKDPAAETAETAETPP